MAECRQGLRKKELVNYQEMVEIKLPKRRRAKDNDLYAVSVIHNDGQGQVKIHYVGYSNSHDEWRDETELVWILNGNSINGIVYAPFSLYNELGSCIKSSLMSRRKESPTVRIESPFDKVLLEGGLKVYGTESRYYRGVQRYKIAKYADLNPLLGQNWHFRGINPNGNFGYVILNITFTSVNLSTNTFLQVDLMNLFWSPET